jgi:hypothetical protein
MLFFCTSAFEDYLQFLRVIGGWKLYNRYLCSKNYQSTTAARLSTAQRRENRTGVGMQNTVKVQGRPVTGQGMSGVQTRAGTAGPRRSIQDSSYYVGLLTAKNTELQTEIRKMQNEIDTHEKDGNLYK